MTEPGASRAYGIVVGGLYAALLAANLYLVWDWWRDTDQGRTTIERLRAKAAQCQGCARRKAKLQAAMNRMHWQADQILEGEDVEVEPEQP